MAKESLFTLENSDTFSTFRSCIAPPLLDSSITGNWLALPPSLIPRNSLYYVVYHIHLCCWTTSSVGVCVCAVSQLGSTLRNMMGSLVYGIFQARIQSKLPLSTPGDLPNPGIKPMSPVSPSLPGRIFTPLPYLVHFNGKPPLAWTTSIGYLLQ